jgi:hypothetical protein
MRDHDDRKKDNSCRRTRTMQSAQHDRINDKSHTKRAERGLSRGFGEVVISLREMSARSRNLKSVGRRFGMARIVSVIERSYDKPDAERSNDAAKSTDRVRDD